jgi:hypothetical protein
VCRCVSVCVCVCVCVCVSVCVDVHRRVFLTLRAVVSSRNLCLTMPGYGEHSGVLTCRLTVVIADGSVTRQRARPRRCPHEYAL